MSGQFCVLFECEAEGRCLWPDKCAKREPAPSPPAAPELPEGWFPHFDHFRHADARGGCGVQFKAGQLHVSEVYVNPEAPLGFSVPLAVLSAALATQGLTIVDAKDRAVLEAMASVKQDALELAHDAPGRMGNAVRAELARRERP